MMLGNISRFKLNQRLIRAIRQVLSVHLHDLHADRGVDWTISDGFAVDT
jgi:hypothetical protein